jgi:hypothetical protein
VVVVEDAVEGLNPFRVHVSVANNPVENIRVLLNHLTGRNCEHTLRKLSGIVVHVTKEGRTRHRFGVDEVNFDWLLKMVVGLLEGAPNSCFSASGRSDQDCSHSLFGCFVELQDFVELVG